MEKKIGKNVSSGAEKVETLEKKTEKKRKNNDLSRFEFEICIFSAILYPNKENKSNRFRKKRELLCRRKTENCF